MEVKVCRGSSFPGECRDEDSQLNWGQDISEAILASEESLMERGRVEIDKSCSNRNPVKVGLDKVKFIQPGKTIGIVLGTSGYNGILRDISMTYINSKESLQFTSSIGIEANV